MSPPPVLPTHISEHVVFIATHIVDETDATIFARYAAELRGVASLWVLLYAGEGGAAAESTVERESAIHHDGFPQTCEA